VTPTSPGQEAVAPSAGDVQAPVEPVISADVVGDMLNRKDTSQLEVPHWVNKNCVSNIYLKTLLILTLSSFNMGPLHVVHIYPL